VHRKLPLVSRRRSNQRTNNLRPLSSFSSTHSSIHSLTHSFSH
jgi:hypothetical protein